MKLLKIGFLFYIAALMSGCASNQFKNDQSLFEDGQIAIQRGDFATASKIFSELSIAGYPEAMNSLGASLFMVDREDEALYWFNMASRYGDQTAKDNLTKMGKSVPPSDLIGRHPTQLQQARIEQLIVTTLTGLALGVTAYYMIDSIGNNYYPVASNQQRYGGGGAIQTGTYQRYKPNLIMSNDYQFSNRNTSKLRNDDQYNYRSFLGNEYKYDLSRPIDRMKYEIDIPAQIYDNISPRIGLDKDMGQFGGGIKP